jgi:outer membrane protein OmpA-like peptidoglycan-associated protein/uncharacterized membrane protein YeaQ/YmgE (transglycosylase-associated protein family)
MTVNKNLMDALINVVMWILFGLIAGAVAKFLMPGKDPGGIIVTILLGIAGALVGGFIGNAFGFGWVTAPEGRTLLDWRNLVLAIGGALLLLLAYRAFRMLFGAAETALASTGTRAAHLAAYEAPVAPNLTEAAKSALTPEVLHKLSSSLGESPGHVRKAMEAMLPTIVAGAASEASTSSGAARLFEIAKESAAGGTDLVSHLADHITGAGAENLGRTGESILHAIFGDRLSSLLSWFVRFAGIKSASASSLMSMAAPLVMSVLGKQILQNGLSVSGLISLLAGQRGWLSKLLPSGVSEIPGLNSLADYTDQAGAAVRGAAEYGEQAIRGTARDAYQAATGLVQPAKPWLSALLPLLLIALALGALPMMMRGCGIKPIAVAKAPEVRVPDVSVPEVAQPEKKDTVVRVDGYGPDLGKLANIKLPDGVNLEIPETSYLHDVYKFLSETGGNNSRTFVFEDLTFDGPSVKTIPATERAVKTVSTLLKYFPGVTIRIEGHTDNLGDPAANRRLSLERANAVKDALVKAGVPPDRISTEGFGSEKPLAPNDTEENRAKNRRIELTLRRGKA